MLGDDMTQTADYLIPFVSVKSLQCFQGSTIGIGACPKNFQHELEI